MFHLLIYFLLIGSSTFGQDSLKTYPVPKWKLDRLLDNYFYDYPACKLTVSTTRQAVDSLKYALTEGQKLIELRTEERDLKVLETSNLRQALAAQEKLTKVEVKKARKKGFRVGFIIGVSLSLLGLTL